MTEPRRPVSEKMYRMSLHSQRRELHGTCTWVIRVGMHYISDPHYKDMTTLKDTAFVWLDEDRARAYLYSSMWIDLRYAKVERAL